MICISCWSHGNCFNFIVAFLWSRQALIHFSFTLLAKHIMWIWSFVPDRPCLTSHSPQAPDASQRSCGGGVEFHWIQRLCRGCFRLLRLLFLRFPQLLVSTCSSRSPCQTIFLVLRDCDYVPWRTYYQEGPTGFSLLLKVLLVVWFLAWLSFDLLDEENEL